MAKALKHKNVPKFSKYKLKIAELCAIEAWNGIDYQTGKKMVIGDEELLKKFSASFFLFTNDYFFAMIEYSPLTNSVCLNEILLVNSNI